MKIHIVVTSDDGTTYEGQADLAPTSSRGPRPRAIKASKPAAITAADSPDFDLPVRAFVNRYAKPLSGPRKYAVLVARLCGGKIGQTVSPREVEKQWRSMTEPMGGDYNGAYATRAKNEGWIDSPDRKSIVLLKDWINALNGK
jgi:hypothetical protein